jgi:hypothetical protein
MSKVITCLYNRVDRSPATGSANLVRRLAFLSKSEPPGCRRTCDRRYNIQPILVPTDLASRGNRCGSFRERPTVIDVVTSATRRASAFIRASRCRRSELLSARPTVSSPAVPAVCQREARPEFRRCYGRLHERQLERWPTSWVVRLPSSWASRRSWLRSPGRSQRQGQSFESGGSANPRRRTSGSLTVSGRPSRCCQTAWSAPGGWVWSLSESRAVWAVAARRERGGLPLRGAHSLISSILACVGGPVVLAVHALADGPVLEDAGREMELGTEPFVDRARRRVRTTHALGAPGTPERRRGNSAGDQDQQCAVGSHL